MEAKHPDTCRCYNCLMDRGLEAIIEYDRTHYMKIHVDEYKGLKNRIKELEKQLEETKNALDILNPVI
jgi:hypothetical protein